MAAAESKRNIPITRLSDFSVIDSEFDSIRAKFDNEMKKMEEEMTKFRQELMSRESSFFTRSTTSRQESLMSEMKKFIDGQESDAEKESSSRFSQSTSSSTSSTSDGSQKTWLEGLNSPLIQESSEGGNKALKLRFDVNQYQPEEIVVKTVDNKLLVHAKHEEKSETKSVYREYNREFMLPKGTNPESITSSLSKDGVLTVEAPLPALPQGEKFIPIAQK